MLFDSKAYVKNDKQTKPTSKWCTTREYRCRGLIRRLHEPSSLEKAVRITRNTGVLFLPNERKLKLGWHSRPQHAQTSRSKTDNCMSFRVICIVELRMATDSLPFVAESPNSTWKLLKAITSSTSFVSSSTQQSRSQKETTIIEYLVLRSSIAIESTKPKTTKNFLTTVLFALGKLTSAIVSISCL